MRRTFVLVLAVLGLAIPAVAAEKEKPLPKGLPPYGPLKPFAPPEVRQEKLASGMTLWLVPRPGFPKVAFALAVRGGMAADPKDRPGLSELLAATIDQGTKTRSAKKIAEEIQAAGGDLSGEALADSLVITTNVLAEKAEAGFAVLADIFQNATFPDDEVALAKRNAADSLRAREAEPSFLAGRALARAVFGEHPYSVVAPTQEAIAKTSAEELRREYARRFRPDQTLLVAVGDFDATAMKSAIENLFGRWTAPKEAAVPRVETPARAAPHAVFSIERAGSVQTTFVLGAFGPTEADPDYAAALVSNAIYGGMFGSRLIKNIREDKGYTYSPFASLETRREAGLLRTQADVRNEVTGASFNEIAYEMNRMATTAPTEEELTRAQRFLVGVRALRLQSREAIARQLARLWTYGLPPEELARESEKIAKVTSKEIEVAGKKYFPALRQTVVAVGEANVIKEQLAPFGLEVRPAP